jgi:predicted acyl esterase
MGLGAIARVRLLAASAGLASLALGMPASAQPAFTPGAGTEGRAWLADRPTADNPVTRYTIAIKDDVIVTARDGTKLEGRLFTPVLPAGAGPTPCVLMTDGYGRTSLTGASLDVPLFDIAARGYAVLHLSLRGSGQSGGTNDLYSHYGTDGYDAIEWMAKQSWCDGRVGMVGPSLLGISQWLAAKEAPPSLKAIVPEVACGDCYGVLWYPGGMLPGPGREARKLSPGAEAEYPTAAAHRDYDEFWRTHTTMAADNAAIAARGVAAFIAGGLDDYISPANIRAYEQFNAPEGAHKRLFLGPYAHGWHTQYFQELQIRWLDHWLKGLVNGAESDPKVVLYIKGANRWRTEADWPLADAHPVRLYLGAAKSGSIASLNDGSLVSQTPGTAPPAVLPYAPETGPFLPVLLSALKRLDIDQHADETKVVTWTTAPLQVATEITGYPKLSVYAASSAADGDFVFDMTDVAPDGTSRQVVQAYLNAQHAGDVDGAPTPLVPGAVRKYELDMFPLAYVFQPGHRIRLAIAGGAKVAPGEVFPQGPGQNPAPFTWTILSDNDHPSAIELPVIGTSWEQLSRMVVTQR